MPLLFVYGTLKRGECRASFLSDEQFLGDVTTRPAYRLIDLGAYPALLREGSVAIEGELYDVSEACLDRLDVVEAVEEGLYERGVVLLAENEHAAEAVTYFYLQSVSGYADAGSSWSS